MGFSVHESFDFFKMVIDSFDWDLTMVQYNYYDRFNQVGERGVKYAASKGIAVATMESLHGGMLANNVPKDVEMAFKGWQPDLSNAEKAFKWLYNQPEVSIVLSGIGTFEQLQDKDGFMTTWWLPLEKILPSVLLAENAKSIVRKRSQL